MITAGVDLGSLTAKAVIMRDGQILAHKIIPVGFDAASTAHKVMNEALKGTGITFDDIEYIVSTGYGRVVVPFAQRNITEITCHAKGANWLEPSIRTVLDMGGQDCKAIRCNETGRVTNFVMNDKCAAGAGRSMEVMAKLVGEPLEDIGKLSLQIVGPPINISSTCVIFARSEVLALLRKGVSKNDILAGASSALASRASNLVKRVDIDPEFAVTGGIAKNPGVISRVEQMLGVKATVLFEPQIIGALGAALFASEMLQRVKKN
jgi:predicted CoA-substrate-specific enzyme activase